MSSKKRIDKNEPEFKASKNLFEAIKRRSNKNLKKTRNSFKKWPLNFWWISNKTIMEVGNITKAVAFKSFLNVSY